MKDLYGAVVEGTDKDRTEHLERNLPHCHLPTYLRTYLITYSIEQSRSWEDNRFSASQEIPRILWNPNVHHHLHKCQPPVPIPSQSISPCPRHVFMFCNKASFYCEDSSANRPNSKQMDNPLSAVRDCIFNIFAATLHTGSRTSICNLRTRHAVVTGSHVSRPVPLKTTNFTKAHF